jgi:hypothetical protein
MSAHTKSIEYATSIVVFPSTEFVTTIIIKIISQDEGDNGHIKTTIGNNKCNHKTHYKLKKPM